MEEQLLRISISVYLEKIDKLFMLQHNVLWDGQIFRGFPYALLLNMLN